MCSGVTGPSVDERPRKKTTRGPRRKAGWKKTPYKDVWGTVVKEYRFSNGYVKLYEDNGRYSVSYACGPPIPQSGSSGFGSGPWAKWDALYEFKRMLPEKERNKI